MSTWIVSDELYHHGIKGQKWGIRRWQNEDGTLTEEGKKKYGTVENFEKAQKRKKIAVGVGAGVAGAAAIGLGVGASIIGSKWSKASKNNEADQNRMHERDRKIAEAMRLARMRKEEDARNEMNAKAASVLKPGFGFDPDRVKVGKDKTDSILDKMVSDLDKAIKNNRDIPANAGPQHYMGKHRNPRKAYF